MTLLNNTDRKILHDGINEQFNTWQKSDPSMSASINLTRHKLFNLVNKKIFPGFRELTGEVQWDFLCSLYCLYHSGKAKKSKFYNDSDIVKVNKKITGVSMNTTIKDVNTAIVYLSH